MTESCAEIYQVLKINTRSRVYLYENRANVMDSSSLLPGYKMSQNGMVNQTYQEESPMKNITILGIDLAKEVF